MTDAEIEKILLEDSKKIYDKLGVFPKYVRFGYNKYDDRVIKVAEKLGFVVTTWNLDSNDYGESLTEEDFLKTYQSKFESNSRGSLRYIALHHDLSNFYPSNPTALPKLGSLMTSYGYTSVGLDKCLNKDQYRQTNTGSDSSSTNSKPNSASGLQPPAVGLAAVFGLVLALL
jgi:peptidoglycan/xylan/chitin deacetylase (PgdA/CDA1 family)